MECIQVSEAQFEAEKAQFEAQRKLNEDKARDEIINQFNRLHGYYGNIAALRDDSPGCSRRRALTNQAWLEQALRQKGEKDLAYWRQMQLQMEARAKQDRSDRMVTTRLVFMCGYIILTTRLNMLY